MGLFCYAAWCLSTAQHNGCSTPLTWSSLPLGLLGSPPPPPPPPSPSPPLPPFPPGVAFTVQALEGANAVANCGAKIIDQVWPCCACCACCGWCRLAQQVQPRKGAAAARSAVTSAWPIIARLSARKRLGCISFCFRLQIVDPIWGCYSNGQLKNSTKAYE